MSAFKLIDFPHSVSLREYDDELSRMTEWLLQFSQVSSVFQVGSVGAPGISDLDMVIVCNDDQKLDVQPLTSLSASGRYLFIHNLYACSRMQFADSARFSFFGTFRQLAGERYPEQAGKTVLSDSLKKQIALEFLLKMYVNCVLQNEYKTLKIRSLLLHVKGLLFDLEFLGVQSGDLFELIRESMLIREKWFDRANSATELMNWFKKFTPALEIFLQDNLSKNKLYISPSSSLRLAKNIRMQNGSVLSYHRKGTNIPFGASLFGPKLHRVLNKINSFRIEVPFIQENIPLDIQEYFTFNESCRKYNETYLPHFYTLSSSLHV